MYSDPVVIDSTLLIVTLNYNNIEYTSLYMHALTYILLLAGTGALMATIINSCSLCIVLASHHEGAAGYHHSHRSEILCLLLVGGQPI
jgi:hypothetical protein